MLNNKTPTARIFFGTVSTIPHEGLGASTRLGAVAHILMGIASDRIPLLLANTKPYGPDWLQRPYGDWRRVNGEISNEIFHGQAGQNLSLPVLIHIEQH
jgi:hypothetical protein